MRRLLVFIFALFSMALGSDLVKVQVDKNIQDKINILIKTIPPSEIKNISLKHQDNTLKSSFNGTPTAIYFFIDTSLPMSDAIDRGVKPFLNSLLQVLPQNINYAIAGFDSEIKLIKPFGENYSSQLNQLSAKGQRTEINRLGIIALEELAKKEEKNKLLILISDGEFEDTAYTIDEFIEKANLNNITILSLGYRDTVKNQGVTKPAINTQGSFWIADKITHQLPKNCTDEILKYISTPKLLSVDKGALPKSMNKTETFDLIVETSTTKIEQKLELPVSSTLNTAIISAVAFIIIVSVVLFFIFRKKAQQKASINKDESIMPTIAKLRDQAGKYYEIKTNSVSIGRNPSNDLVIDGQFISNFHADIIFKNGDFFINDKNSTNGVKLNGKQITQAQLSDGDIIEFGSLQLVFQIS